MLTLLVAAALSVLPVVQQAALAFAQGAHLSLLGTSAPCQALAGQAAQTVRVMGQQLPLAGVFSVRLPGAGARSNVLLAALAGPPEPYRVQVRTGSVNELDVTLANTSLVLAAFQVTASAPDGEGRGCLLVYLPDRVTDGPQRLTRPASPSGGQRSEGQDADVLPLAAPTASQAR